MIEINLPADDESPWGEKLRTAILAILELANTTAETTSQVAQTVDGLAIPTPAEIEAQVAASISALVAGSPEALNTLDEIASALGDDPNFATTLLQAVGQKADAAATTAALAERITTAVAAARFVSRADVYPWQAGYYYFPIGGANHATSNGFTLNMAYLTGFVLDKPIHIDRLFAEVGLAAAGSVVRLGVYGTQDGVPGPLLVDGGTIDGSTAGVKELTIPDTILPAGVIWLATVAQGTAVATLRTAGSSAFSEPVIGRPSLPGTGFSTIALTRAGIAGALPATLAGAGFSTAGLAVRVGVRVSP